MESVKLMWIFQTLETELNAKISLLEQDLSFTNDTHAAEIQELKDSHQAELVDVRQNHQAELNNMKENHQAALFQQEQKYMKNNQRVSVDREVMHKEEVQALTSEWNKERKVSSCILLSYQTNYQLKFIVMIYFVWCHIIYFRHINKNCKKLQ